MGVRQLCDRETQRGDGAACSGAIREGVFHSCIVNLDQGMDRVCAVLLPPVSAFYSAFPGTLHVIAVQVDRGRLNRSMAQIIAHGSELRTAREGIQPTLAGRGRP